MATRIIIWVLTLSPWVCCHVQFASEQKDLVWKTVSPKSQGVEGSRLARLRDDLSTRGTSAFLVIRNDCILCEWYAPGHGPNQQHYTASLAKALVGGMSLLVALNDGRIRLDDFACEYIPKWKNDSLKSKITIGHLVTHSSGIEDAEVPGKSHEELTGWKGAFWSRYPDPFSIALDQATMLFSPGTRFAYSNPGMAALGYALTSCLRGAPQSNIRTLLKERIMDPIGVSETDWSIGYERAFELDGMKLYATWGGAAYTPRAVANVGRLMLQKGGWEGRRLIEPAWVERAIRYAGTPLPNRSPGDPQPASGLGWWTNFDSVWPSVPRDAFVGAGAGNQLLLVIPSLELIVVRNGELLGDPAKGESFWAGLEKYLFDPLMNAIN